MKSRQQRAQWPSRPEGRAGYGADIRNGIDQTADQSTIKEVL
jgi:hypothetical protein